MTKDTQTEAQKALFELVRTRMPFGKYQGTPLSDLPVSYLEWFGRNGMPKGKLGNQLNLLLTIKSNGLDHLLHKIKQLEQDEG